MTSKFWITVLAFIAITLVASFPPVSAQFSYAPNIVPPPATCSGTNYYVSNSGSDAANGTSPATAWQTIAHVNAHSTFIANQCISFMGGQTFTGNLVLSTVNSCSICAPTPSTVNVSSVSPTTPITVQSYGTGNATLTSNTGGDISSTVLVNSVNGFVVKGLTIRSGISGACPSSVGANCTTAGVYVTGASTGTVTGNDIGGFFVNDGITIGGGDITSSVRTDSSGTVTFSLNTLHGLTAAALDDDGVQVNGSTGTIAVTGNMLYNFGGRPSFLATFGGEGMNLLHSHSGTILVNNNVVHDIGYNQTTQCGGSSGIETNDISNGTISGNQVYNTGINITTGCDGDGIDLDGSTTNTVVEYNYTHNNAGAGLYGWMGQSVGDWTGNTYRDNISENDAYIIADNPQEFFGGMSFNNTGCSACVVYAYGNTIYQNSSLTGRGAFVLATQNGTATVGSGSVIADNIFAYTSGNYAVTCYPGIVPSTATWRNNSYFAIGGGTSVRVDTNCGSSGSPNGSLAQWETRTGETGGVTSNPGFVGTVPAGAVVWNTSGYQTLPSGYALSSGSPLIGVGIFPSSLSVPSVPPSVDFYGNTQPNASGTGWDIGAFGGGSTSFGTTTAFMSTWQNSWSYENVVAGTDYTYNETSNHTYQLVSSGTCVSAATGTGPLGTGTNIADGTCTWNYVVGGSQLIVPANYISTTSIEAIGGGGGGSNGSGIAFGSYLSSGGGGAYSKITSFVTSPGTIVPFSAGFAGVGGVANGSTLNPGANAQAAIFGGTGGSFGTCTAAAAVSAPLCADFGVGGNISGGTGGLASNSIGSTKYNGGSSGVMPGAAAPGAGGAGGPHGAGATGGTASSVGSPTIVPGAGGAGADDGTAGSTGNSTTGGNGGENYASTGAGIGTTGAGGNGTNGGGGAGSGTTGNAGNGGCGSDFDSLHGAGGGGGGATSYATAIAGNGACGGGGASAAPGSPLAGGNGGNGVIAFKYQYCSVNCGGGTGATISSITPSPSSGTLTTGTVTFTVQFSAAVIVAGGTPTLNLNTATPSAASYTSGSGTNQLVFTYNISSGETASPVATTSSAISLNGATIQTSGINDTLTGANSLTFTGLIFNPSSAGGPTVSSITSTCSGSQSVGAVCTYHVNFSQAVTVGGSWHPRLNLATSPVPSIAYYSGGSGTSTLNFVHTVWGGQIESTVSTSSSAISLNSATIQNSSGTNATLTGANSQSIAGLAYAPGNAYCVEASGGNDSSSGICGTASFATLTHAQTAAQGGSVKTIYLQSGGGSYIGLATCNFSTNTGATMPAYICLTGTTDNNEIWAAYPGQAPIMDGNSNSSANSTTALVGDAFTPFVAGNGGGNSVSGVTIQGITFQNFQSGLYLWNPVNFTATDNTFNNMYNDGGSYCAGDCIQGNGAAGALAGVYNFWSNIQLNHNLIENTAASGVTFNGAYTTEGGQGSYTMTGTMDNNNWINTSQICGDCGAIYAGWFPGAFTAWMGPNLMYITNNYIQNAGESGNYTGRSNGGTFCIYLDNFASGDTITGNLCTGTFTQFIITDITNNTTISNNIADISGPSVYDAANSYWASVFYWSIISSEPNPGCGTNNTCPTGTNVNINGNIIYNGSTSPPPSYMGIFYNTGLSATPTMGTNWYYTATGTFSNPPFCWGFPQAGGANDLPCNSAGVLANPNFVNPSAGTTAGFQMNAGSTPLNGGFNQIVQTQGPR